MAEQDLARTEAEVTGRYGRCAHRQRERMGDGRQSARCRAQARQHARVDPSDAPAVEIVVPGVRHSPEPGLALRVDLRRIVRVHVQGNPVWAQIRGFEATLRDRDRDRDGRSASDRMPGTSLESWCAASKRAGR